MNPANFRFHALSWLRDSMNVRTDCLPHEEIEDADGVAITDATIVRARHGNPYMQLALWSFATSYALGLAAGHNLVGEFQHIVGALTGVAALAAVVFFALALRRRRGQRESVVIELRARTSAHGLVDAEAIRALREEAAGENAWMVSEAGFTADAVALAGPLCVRCFAAKGEAFVEVKPQLLEAASLPQAA